MERLQSISTGIVIAIAIFGACGWLYNQYNQPDLNDGKYFESAWLDVKNEQLTLYVEFIPDGKGNGVKAAMEAVCRVKDKAWINNAIDGRPIVVVMMVRDDIALVPMAAIVIYDNGLTCNHPLDATEILRKSARNMTFLYNGTSIDVINKSSGERFSVNTSEFKSKVEAGSFLYSTFCEVPVIYKYSECVD